MNSSDKTPTSSPDRWQRLWDIFHEARDKEPSERDIYLNDACGSNTELLHEVKELLDAEDEAGGLLEEGRAITRELRQDTVPVPEYQAEEFFPGKILSDRFQIVEQIGQGGMGTVYKAIDLELGRQVALKFLHLEDPRWTRRFLLEARFQARIEHEHICKVYEVGEIEGKQYIAMQFIAGKTLLEAAPLLKMDQKVRLLQQVCEAVHAAHSLGVIHRDIKPTNILVGKTDSGDLIPFVTDFGLAREVSAPGVTSTGMVMGTAWYMAPEQARGEIRKLDLRCDIHALGATLYELLCGKPPFDGDSSVEVLLKVINEDAPRLRQQNPQIPADLETIVHKCLQKEPARRYETAAALAEDLRRFSEGEPILARPVTWSHRTIKRVKKYPVISGLLAAALVIVIAVAGFAVWTWWRAQAQAKIANEFEQEIRYMEETARHAYTEPLHDVRKEEAIVEQRLNAIAKRINDAGSVAEGPGNFAMGRGYMALYRYPEAKAHLEKAWKEYRIPRVAFALGLTLGLMYPKEMDRANQIGTKEEREAKKNKVIKEFKEPALQLIKEGSTAIETPEYIEGLIAYLDKRYPEALQKTRIAFQRQPWFFEAKKLEADIIRAMANERRGAGDVKSAIELYKKAEAAYRESVRRGSSYAIGYNSLCGLGHDWTGMMRFQTGFLDETVIQKSIEACNLSLKINPNKPEAYIAKGGLKGMWASYQMEHGVDPTADFNEAIALAQKALKWEWVRYAAYTNMAISYSALAEYKQQNGKDEGAFLDHAIENNRQAVRLNPNSHTLHNNLGITLAKKSDYEKRKGRDAKWLDDQAIQEFQEAIRILPDYTVGYNSLGNMYFEKAQSEYEQGSNPGSFAELSIKNLKKSLEINPTFFVSYNSLGETYKLQARHAMEHSLDSTPFLNQAIQSFQKANEINPENIAGYNGLGAAYRIRAEFEMSQKRDPSSFLLKGQEALKKAKQLAPELSDFFLLNAEIEVTSAEWKMNQGLRKEAVQNISSGLEDIGKALSKNPSEPEAHALKGTLLLLQARSLSSKPAQKQAAFEAEASLQKALRLNSKLARKYAASLQEAKKLAEL